MYLSNKDYLDILHYYKIEIPKNKKLIKNRAESILANKLCRCIKKIDDFPHNESKAIAICSKSILNKRGLKGSYLKCKNKAKISLTKKNTGKNLVKTKKRKTRRR